MNRVIQWSCGVSLAFVLGGAAHADPPLPVIPATNFNVTSFGAFGDGISNNATAIQNTINAASAAGGGTVVVAAVGILTNYLSGPVTLASKVSLQINAGTKLQMLPYASWPGTTTFINGSGLTDVEIDGSGTIDGNAGFTSGFFTNWWGPPPPSNSPVASRPNMINFGGCMRVLIQGVTLQNPPTFHIMAKGNNVNLTIQNMTEDTIGTSHNTDGMDIGSSNVLVRNCTINVGDDNIEIGGSTAAVVDMTVSNCSFGTGHGVSLGSLVNGAGGGVRNLIVSNCTFNGTDYGIRMKSDRDRGGVCENLRYLDITMTNVDYPIVIYSYYNSVGTPNNITAFRASTDTVHIITGTTPIWRNITISNLTATSLTGSRIAGIIWGVPEMLVSNVTLYNVNISAPTKTFDIYNARDIRIVNSQIATPSSTNSFTLYNAEVIITNTVANTNLVTLGGLAVPPTNNTLALFNTQVAVTETDVLGNGSITLGGSSLTFTQGPVSVSNNLNAVSASMLVLLSDTNTFDGTPTGSGPLSIILTNSSGLRFNQTAIVWGGTNIAFDAGSSGTINNRSVGNRTIVLGALDGGTGSKLRGSDSNSGVGVDQYVIGSLNSNTTFAGTVADGLLHTTALIKIGTGTFTLSGTNSYTGATTVSNGTLAVNNVLTVGGSGASRTLTAAGGITSIQSNLVVAVSANATGTVFVAGGEIDIGGSLVLTNPAGAFNFNFGTVSANGVIQANPAAVTVVGNGGTALLTLSTGIHQFAGPLVLGNTLTSTGTLVLASGQLIVTNAAIVLGGFTISDSGVGLMTVSNGIVKAFNLVVGSGISSAGTLTVPSGMITVNTVLVGQTSSSSGTVWMTGGQLIATNNFIIGNSGKGQMTVSNGTVSARLVTMGTFSSGAGTLTAVGGTSSVYSNMTLGNFACTATGIVNVAGGNLFVTNAAGNATLEVRSGTLVLNSGTLTVDKFVMTNACGHFTRTGGTLVYSNAVLNAASDADGDGIPNGYEQSHGLDPLNPADATLDSDGDGLSNLQEFLAGTDATNSASAFRITSITQVATNILVTWQTAPGKTNALQRTAGEPGGSYSTNNFTDVFTVTNTVGSVTNYLDIGAATNFPARYYRVRLVP